MRKKGLFVLAMALFLFITMAVFAQAQEDIQKHPSCRYCGMNRQQFAHSRIFIEYDDALTVGTCSIHCAAVDLAINLDKTPKALQVGDYITKNLTDAERAFWVIGGSKMGVMTQRAKWAFEKKEDAEKFIKENGGESATFDVTMKAAYEDMYADTKRIRERRKMKKMEHKK